VAGSRHVKQFSAEPPATSSKGKGKRKRDQGSELEDASDLSEPEPSAKRHGGRRAGAGNYKEAELNEILNLVEKELPLGQSGWKRIHARYATWATKNKTTIRDARAIENKFKSVSDIDPLQLPILTSCQLVKTKKPTGNAKRPESVTRAKAIDRLIIEKSGTININDTDDSDGDQSDGSEREQPSRPSDVVHTVVARADRSETAQPR